MTVPVLTNSGVISPLVRLLLNPFLGSRYRDFPNLFIPYFKVLIRQIKLGKIGAEGLKVVFILQLLLTVNVQFN